MLVSTHTDDIPITLADARDKREEMKRTSKRIVVSLNVEGDILALVFSERAVV